jgi:hypothetical protein
LALALALALASKALALALTNELRKYRALKYDSWKSLCVKSGPWRSLYVKSDSWVLLWNEVCSWKSLCIKSGSWKSLCIKSGSWKSLFVDVNKYHEKAFDAWLVFYRKVLNQDFCWFLKVVLKNDLKIVFSLLCAWLLCFTGTIKLMFERLEWNIERKIVDIWSLYLNIWLVSWIFCICTLDLLLCRNSRVDTWRLGCKYRRKLLIFEGLVIA